MDPFIVADNLRKTYRVGKIEVPALRGVSFMVDQGEFVTIVGPSGSGKSTLFYLLGGLTRADSGRIVVAGDGSARECVRIGDNRGTAGPRGAADLRDGRRRLHDGAVEPAARRLRARPRARARTADPVPADGVRR